MLNIACTQNIDANTEIQQYPVIPPEVPYHWRYTIFTHIILSSQERNCFEITSHKDLRMNNKVKSLQVTVNGERLKKLMGVITE